ncbi:MAG: hypothetical protein HC905_04425 [Bacteroidales bacterium]|nr:hypothetical protein [Bacteroidales bacterium]
MAVQYDKFAYCIILDKLLLHYLNRYQFSQLSEDDLLRVQSELRKHIQYELNLAEHASLYELLNYRFIVQGSIRSTKDKDKLNDLVFTEMNLAGNPRFQSFDLKKNHLLFQSVYFMMVGDHKSSLQTFYELNALFEQSSPFVGRCATLLRTTCKRNSEQPAFDRTVCRDGFFY